LFFISGTPIIREISGIDLFDGLPKEPAAYRSPRFRQLAATVPIGRHAFGIDPWKISGDLASPRVPAAPELYITVHNGPSALAVGPSNAPMAEERGVQVPVPENNAGHVSPPL
jgi:hypothetical protein